MREEGEEGGCAPKKKKRFDILRRWKSGKEMTWEGFLLLFSKKRLKEKGTQDCEQDPTVFMEQQCGTTDGTQTQDMELQRAEKTSGKEKL